MQNAKKKWAYWIIGTVSGLCLVLLLLIALSPVIAKYLYKDWLKQQGLQGEIEKIEFGLFAGKLSITNVTVQQSEKQQLQLGKLELEIDTSDILGRKITIKSVKINDLNILARQASNAIYMAGINLGKTGEEKGKDSADKSLPWNLSINKLNIDNIQACFIKSTSQQKTSLNICQSVGHLKWSGLLSYDLAAPINKAIHANGDLSITNATLTDKQNKLLLMSLKKFKIDRIDLASINKLNIQQVLLQDYAALQKTIDNQKGVYTLQWKKLALHKINLSNQNKLTIDNIKLAGYSGNILITSNKHLKSIEYIQDLLPETGSQNEQQGTVPFSIKIGEISAQTEDSISITDNSVKPPVHHTLGKIEIQLSDINNMAKEQFSSIKARLAISSYGSLVLAGKGQFFADKPSYFINAKIKALDLAELSSYSKLHLQHDIKSGQLDAELDVKIDHGQLDSKASIYLHKFYVQETSIKDDNRLQEQLGMPLPAVLSLLRSKDDQIKIKLPVTGNLENPDFSLSNVISTVSAKAIKSAIINYYTSFGLVPVLEKTFDLATALRFKPVIFQAKETSLDSSNKQQLDNISNLLKERPAIHLVICGHVTRDDRFSLFPQDQEWFNERKKAQDTHDASETDESSINATPLLPSLSDNQLDKLVSIAKQRAENVKSYLVSNRGIGADRLILCNPAYDQQDAEPPYVEIKI